MTGLYNIGAAKGSIVGQGLLGVGQGASAGILSHRKAKLEAEEREEKKKTRQFTKTLSLVNLYTKMGDDLTPEDRTKLYTGALVPMLAKAGGLPEGVKQEDVSQFIGSLAAHSKEAMQGFREDNDKLLDLANEGKWKEADKFLTGMMTEYGRLPGAKGFLDHAKTLLKDEKEYGRGQEEKKGERKEEVEDKIAGWLAEGRVKEIPKGGLMSDLGEKGTTFKYGGRQFFKPEEEEELGFEEKERIKAKYKKKGEGPEVKESTAIKEMEAIKRGIDRFQTTGGLSDILFTQIRSYDPEFADDMKKMPHDEAIEFMKKRYNYLFDNFVTQKNKNKYKLERFEEKKAPTSNVTHRFVPGKGLVAVE